MLAFARNYELNREVIGIPELVRGMTDLLQRSFGAIVQPRDPFPSLPQASRRGLQSAGARTPQSHSERPRCHA
jgi:hypothetical protein